MERDLIDSKDPIFSQSDDAFVPVKQEFGKIYYDNNLDALHNANDLGFIGINKMSHKLIFNENGDTQGLSEFDTPFKMNIKEEQSPMNRSMMNTSSPAVFFNKHAGSYPSNNGHNNLRYHLFQESFDLTPFKKPYHDEFSRNFDNQFGENSNPPNFPESNTQSEVVDNYMEFPLTLQWSNCNGRKKNPETPNNFFKSQLKFGPELFDNGFGEEESNGFKEYKENEKSSQETNKMFHLKEEPKIFDDISVIKALKIESFKDQKSMKTPNKKTSADFKTTCRSTPASRETAHREEEEEENENDNENDGECEDGKNRSSRGLRVLSVKVKDIVAEKQTTSYKEVADALISEFNLKFKKQKPGEAKDEQNVKRRVYDALNVLIAADILKKDGKTVFCDKNLENLGPPKRMKLKEEKEKLIQQIHELKRKNKHKSDLIQELTNKCLAVKNLIKRNKENIIVEDQIGQGLSNTIDSENIKEEKNEIENKENTVDNKSKRGKKAGDKSPMKKGSKKGKGKETEEEKKVNETENFQEKNQIKVRKDEIIKFPFIVLVNSSTENAMNLNMGSSQTRLYIESKNPFNVYGDIDILMKMGLNKVSKEFFEANIPAETQKYLSKNYMESLLK